MLNDSPDGWAWFDGKAGSVSDSVDVRRHFVRAFNSDAGRQVLNYLRAATVERRAAPETPDSVLRHLEGQRYLFQLIERLADSDNEEFSGNE